MSTLAELLPLLEQGAILQSSRGESLRLVGAGKVEWIRAKGYRFEEEIMSMQQVKALSDVWDWSVVGAPREEER
jgi:hypothetical protein